MAPIVDADALDAVNHAPTTTRAVRRWLDRDRRVPLEVVRESLQIVSQMRSVNHAEPWHLGEVTDTALKDAAGRYNRESYRALNAQRGASGLVARAMLVGKSSSHPAKVMPRSGAIAGSGLHHEVFDDTAQLPVAEL